MTWGGKLFFGALGYLIGGPVGLVIGLILGHLLDRGVDRVKAFNPFRPYAPGEKEQVQDAFFTTVFSIMGHLAKADGRVSEQEIALAKAVMDRMQLSEEQRQRARELFQQGKADDFPLDEVLARFRHQTRFRKHMILVFLETLLQVALADGHLDSREEQLLLRVARGLGLPEAQFRQILAMLLAQAQFAGSAGGGAGAGAGPAQSAGPGALEQAYAVLGVSSAAGQAEIKRAYRKLMSQHHPDRLAAQGVPEEMIRVATEKSAEITRAYDTIKKARGFK
ncbi:MAG: co-chaperone DjlA [Alcanivoracaceae bacterium]|nr:co-chaperone DjlA [Alcanivoracaceae bacterium]